MSLAQLHDPLTAAIEIREQMATHERRVALLLGAGVSMAAGVQGLDQLTGSIESRLAGEEKEIFDKVRKSIGSSSTVEDVLDHLRLLRELLAADSSQPYEGINGDAARRTDVAICQEIRKAVLGLDLSKMDAHLSLASWIRSVNRDQPIEIFTTNYDLLLEMAFEEYEVPYFDGFVGAVKPFFVPECVEADTLKQAERDYPPKAWTRLWKLHGSIGWYVGSITGGRERIIRGSADDIDESVELVIYPSREKYRASRKLPFMSYLDRLRKVLSTGECLLLVGGYSFRDQHINEVLRQGLRSNTRLAINAFMFGAPSTDLLELAHAYKNVSVFGPLSACLCGRHGAWLAPSRKKHAGEEWPFWDETNNRFTLGDFRMFGQFLHSFMGGWIKPAAGFVPLPPQGGTAQP